MDTSDQYYTNSFQGIYVLYSFPYHYYLCFQNKGNQTFYHFSYPNDIMNDLPRYLPFILWIIPFTLKLLSNIRHNFTYFLQYFMIICLIPLCKGSQSLSQRSSRLIPEVLLQRCGIGIGNWHVARLHCHEFLVRLKIVIHR